MMLKKMRLSSAVTILVLIFFFGAPARIETTECWADQGDGENTGENGEKVTGTAHEESAEEASAKEASEEEASAKETSPSEASKKDVKQETKETKKKGEKSKTAEDSTVKPNPWAVGVTQEQRTRAIKLFRQGNTFFEQSQYAQALVRYRSALEQWDHPAIRYNATVCLINLDQPLEAWEFLNKALRYGQGPLDAKLYAQAKTYKNLLKGRLGFIKIVCKEKKARVTLDGKFLFTAPGEIQKVVEPGTRQVVASKSGFITATRDVDVLPGKEKVVLLKLVSLEDATKKKRRWRRFMPWTVFGGGVAVAGIGVGLLFKALADYEKHEKAFDDACPTGCYPSDVPSNVKDMETQANRLYYSSIAVISLGATTLAAGVLLIILNQPQVVKSSKEDQAQPKAPKSVSVLPVALPGGGMVTGFFSF